MHKSSLIDANATPPPSRRWARLLKALRWSVAPAVLVLLAWHVDLGAAWKTLRNASPVWLLIGVAVVQLQVVLSAQRWRLTAARLGVPITPGDAIGEYYLATLLNQALPGGVGGDAVRAWRQAADRQDTAGALRAVVLERMAGQVAFFALAVFGLAAWPLLAAGRARPPGIGMSLLIAVCVLVGLVLCVLVLARFGPAPVRRALQGLGPDLAQAWWRQGAWWPQLTMSMLIVTSYVAVFAVCARAVGDVLPALAWLTVLPLTLASMLLPVSVGGWGVREAVAAALWPLLALPSAHGVAASVLYGLVNLVGALPGLWRLKARRHRAINH